MNDQEPLEIAWKDVHATHDLMGKTLRVDAVAHVPGGGFAVSIEPWQRGGINPMMFMMAVQVTPTGESPSTQTVHWDQPWEDDAPQYSEVGFVSAGFPAKVPDAVPVEEVQ